VATDDLSAPLGQQTIQKKKRAVIATAIPVAIAGVLGLSLLGFAGWAMMADDPLGGEPMALVHADLSADNAGKPSEDAKAPKVVPGTPDPDRAPGAPAEAKPVPPPGSKTVTIIDGSSGKREDVFVPGTGEAKTPALDERVSEPSRHGLLPKVAQDGTRPADVFARPVKPLDGKPNAPRIAILVGGLGIGATATSEAIRKLPGPVTLAFGPYGGDLDRQVARAREAEHEVLLQVPMEPADYPDNDPGPQTLLTSLDASQNIDRLQWQMSRFQGYVGLTNLMGARFSANEAALAPVLRETAKRGLLFVDDGSSPRSLASQIAGANNLAYAKADVILDNVPTGADIDRALARLEAVAHERGVAIGVASALPVTVERLVKWSKTAASRGVLLVPISAAVPKPRSS
jgi:hypothetical protein